MSATLHELREATGAGDRLVAVLDAGGFWDSSSYAECVAIALSNQNKSVEYRQALAFHCAGVARCLLYGLLREAEIAHVEIDLGESGRDVPVTG